MKFDHQHIDLQEIKNYLNGKMSSIEKHAFELKMENDPFLYEAVEGYQENPEAIDRISNIKKDHLASRRSFFGSRTLAVLGVVAGIYIIALIVNGVRKEDPELAQDDTSIETVAEVEIVPESIDSFVLADLEEQISVIEISENKQLIEEYNLQEEDNTPEMINIEEDPEIEIDPKLYPETENKNRTNYAPSTHYFDLYVVDYREIKRKNEGISYTRYELSGLSAEYESEDSKNGRDLVEKHVEVPYMEYLETSMDYFSTGNYKKALNRYLTIIEQYPEDLNAHFYGGHCYYNLRKYNEALDFFDKTLKHEKTMNFVAFRQEAKWYKAKTLIKLNRTQEARQILDEIIIEGQFYSKDAILLKEKL